MYLIHIGWAYWKASSGNVFVSGTKKPDNVHQWFKVYRT